MQWFSIKNKRVKSPNSHNKAEQAAHMAGSQSEPEVEIELDADYQARKKKEEDLQNAYRNGRGTEQQYDFASKRLTITNYKSLKSDKISTI